MVNRWGINGNSDRLYFFELQITADGDFSHEIKRRLLLGRKAVINLDSILKYRDITLPTKIYQASVCSSILSHQNKDLEWSTLSHSWRVTTLGSWTDRVIALRSWMDRVIALIVLQLSVTALFYLDDSRKSIFKAWGHVDPKMRREECSNEHERACEWALWLLFLCFFLPPGLALCKLGLVRSAVLPEVLILVLGPSFVLFLRAFPFLIF